jgi:sporulation protein YlmC with PRC-barrel domain
MRHHNTILLSVAMLSVAGLPAQDERKPDLAPRDTKQSQLQARDPIPLSDVLGAKVRLSPSAEERGEAASEHRAPDRPTGSIDDLIIDCKSGKVTWAVVSVGGLLGVGAKEVAIPASALKPSRDGDNDPVYDLSATEAELKALRAFDKDMLKKGDFAAILHAAESSWNKVRPDGTDPRPIDASGQRREIGTDGDTKDDMKNRDTHATLGSKLEGMTVCTSDAKEDSDSKERKDFGEVDSACVDLHTNAVTYLVVGHGGVVGIGKTRYLIPFGAVRTVLAADTSRPLVVVAKTATEMETAPKYNKPDKAFLTDESARSSCEFFGVEHGKSPETLGTKADKGYEKRR